MRYLILSDMHANWEAFEAVLHRARRKRFDAVLALGDLVGYGAAPNQVVEGVRALPGKVWLVRGNHDKVVTGIDTGGGFNQAALAAAQWTAGRLTRPNFRFVKELPLGPVEVAPGLVICHGSPLDEDAYVFSDVDAYEIFSAHAAPVTFFGHTHIPSLFTLERRGIGVRALRGASGRIALDPARRYLVNPGSIGQPRDRDPRAAWMLIDLERWTASWRRVEYPVEEAARAISETELPGHLADRLFIGQ